MDILSIATGAALVGLLAVWLGVRAPRVRAATAIRNRRPHA